MKQIASYFSKAMLLPMVFTFTTCWGGFSFELVDFVSLTKSSTTLEDLDTNNFAGTALTSAWTGNQRNLSYNIEGEIVYIHDCTKLYGLAAFAYGWLLDGKSISYPLGWKVNGHQKGWAIEFGYIYSVCKNFDLLPHFGWSWGITDSKIKNQHNIYTTPVCLIDRGGTRSSMFLYFPYIGLDISFPVELCKDFILNFTLGADFGYARGKGRTSVPHIIITDDPGTSLYGSSVKYRDMITQAYKFAVGHKFAPHWKGFIEFSYDTTYNTHKLPIKLQRNREVVEAGQFTPTQTHKLNESISQTYSFVLGLVYQFDEKGTADIIIR